MAVAYQSHQYAESGTGTTLTITKPANSAEGDMLVAVLNSGSSTTWTTLSGWTLVGSVESSNFPTRMSIQAKIATAGDVAASDFTFTNSSSGSPKQGAVYRITGDFSSSSTPTDYIIVDTDNSVTPTAGTATFPGGLTPLATNPLLIFAVTCGEDPGADAPQFSAYAVANNNPTWTEDVDEGIQDPVWMNLGLAHASYASASATGAYSLTSGRTSVHGGALVAINERTNVTVTPNPVTMTASVPAPSVAGDANVSPAVVTMTSSVQAPTVSAGTAKWVNTDKSAAGSITNTDKS